MSEFNVHELKGFSAINTSFVEFMESQLNHSEFVPVKKEVKPTSVTPSPPPKKVHVADDLRGAHNGSPPKRVKLPDCYLNNVAIAAELCRAAELCSAAELLMHLRAPSLNKQNQ